MKPPPYEELRLKKMEENQKMINALKLRQLSQSISKPSSSISKPSSKMDKEKSLKPKLKAQDKGGTSTSKFELPNARSSIELARIFSIKRENLANNIEKSVAQVVGTRENVRNQNKLSTTNVVKSNATRLDKEIHRVQKPLFRIAPQAPIKLSNFTTIGQKDLTSNRGPDPTKEKFDAKKVTNEASVTKNHESRQNQDPKGNLMTQIKGSLQKKEMLNPKRVTNEASVTKNQGSKQYHDQIGNLMTQTKGFVQNQHPKKKHVRKVVLEEVESPMKINYAENENLGTRENPKKRVGDEDDEVMESQQSATKKTKRIPLCKSTTIVEFLKENNVLSDEEDEEELENEDEDGEYAMEEENEEEGGENNGTIKKKTRGPTQCLKIHGRKIQDRQEVILDDIGEPIGPDEKVVSDLSMFLGTVARNSAFCPFLYTNFKKVVENHGEDIWNFVQRKFIIPEKGRKGVFSRINDAWRRYKRQIKQNHYLPYSTLKDRLKHRPEEVPEPHFRKLLKFWDHPTIQKISQKNTVNKAKQKFIHRMGPKNFAMIRQKLRAKKDDGEEVTQAEMFIETRQPRKGKVDEETEAAVAKLQDSIQDSNQSPDQVFQSLFGKEKPGRVRCFGRTATPSMLKKNEEIANIKKHYEGEMTSMKERMEAYESLTKKRMEAYESLLKCVLVQQNPNLSQDDVENMMGHALGIANSAVHHSSASTHVPEKFGTEDDLQEE